MLEKALSGVKESLAADGYELAYEQPQEGTINIVIKAGPNACAECLVPKSILEQMILRDLSENGVPYKKVNIQLPIK